MSFDRNADHRISREELPERMQALVARGDRNADADLDLDEIRSLMNAASAARVRVGFRSQPFHTESSDGLPGVIQDLKLPPQKHALAFAIASRPHLLRADLTSQEVYGEMRYVLDDEEYDNFAAAAARVSKRHVMIID